MVGQPEVILQSYKSSCQVLVNAVTGEVDFFKFPITRLIRVSPTHGLTQSLQVELDLSVLFVGRVDANGKR